MYILPRVKEYRDEWNMDQTETVVGIFFVVSGYCVVRRLYQAILQHTRARRDLDNAYMNLITSMEDPRNIV